MECYATVYTTGFCNLFKVYVRLATTQHGEKPAFVRYAVIFSYQLQRKFHQWNMAWRSGFFTCGMYPPHTVFCLAKVTRCQVAKVTECQSGHAGKHKDITYQIHIVFWQMGFKYQVEFFLGQTPCNKRFGYILVIHKRILSQ